jgi:hypothetical protein
VSVSQLPEGVSLVDLLRELAELRRVVVEQADRIAELERRLTKDSSTSSRPPTDKVRMTLPGELHRAGQPGTGHRAASSVTVSRLVRAVERT